MHNIEDYLQLNVKFRVKYMLDRIIACLLCGLLAPVFLLLMFSIKMYGWLYQEDVGSIFYLEPRITAGKIFYIIKFRTVTMNAVSSIKNKQRTKSITGSPHKTRMGWLILKWYLDELPQLFNIAKGELSFVGPRPHIIAHHENDIKSGMIYRNISKQGF